MRQNLPDCVHFLSLIKFFLGGTEIKRVGFLFFLRISKSAVFAHEMCEITFTEKENFKSEPSLLTK